MIKKFNLNVLRTQKCARRFLNNYAKVKLMIREWKLRIREKVETKYDSAK